MRLNWKKYNIGNIKNEFRFMELTLNEKYVVAEYYNNPRKNSKFYLSNSSCILFPMLLDFYPNVNRNNSMLIHRVAKDMLKALPLLQHYYPTDFDPINVSLIIDEVQK